MVKMDDYKTNEEVMAEVLESMTPLEQAIHNATLSAYRIAHYVNLAEMVDHATAIATLEQTDDLEDRALLPLAESGLVQLIMLLPPYGDA